jgi:hypothetical protein
MGTRGSALVESWECAQAIADWWADCRGSGSGSYTDSRGRLEKETYLVVVNVGPTDSNTLDIDPHIAIAARMVRNGVGVGESGRGSRSQGGMGERRTRGRQRDRASGVQGLVLWSERLADVDVPQLQIVDLLEDTGLGHGSPHRHERRPGRLRMKRKGGQLSVTDGLSVCVCVCVCGC